MLYLKILLRARRSQDPSPLRPRPPRRARRLVAASVSAQSPTYVLLIVQPTELLMVPLLLGSLPNEIFELRQLPSIRFVQWVKLKRLYAMPLTNWIL